MRVTNAPASRRRRKRTLDAAKGFYGGRSKLIRTAVESVDHAKVQATKHRRTMKRDYRALWIVRLSAAARLNGLTYSRLMEGLTKAGVALNRKMLSEIAIHDAEGFASLAAMAKTQLA